MGKVAPIAGSRLDVAARYGSSLYVVKCLIRSGKLPAYKLGRRVFIKFADADKVFFGNRKK
jgi:hypothetical protein